MALAAVVRPLVITPTVTSLKYRSKARDHCSIYKKQATGCVCLKCKAKYTYDEAVYPMTRSEHCMDLPSGPAICADITTHVWARLHMICHAAHPLAARSAGISS